MEAWNSFLQTVFRFVKSLFVNVSKKMHRNAVVLTTGLAVVTVVTLTAGDFHGGGKSALIAFAETPQPTESAETELEETQAATEPAAEPTSQEAEPQEAAEPETEASESEGTKAAELENTQAESTEAESTEPESASEESTAAETTAAASETESAGEEQKELKDEHTEPESEAAAEVFACSASDYRVLLRIVQAEAGICDTKGRILVANVILNRVKSSQFPNTISKVVYEKSQFSPVSDGSIDTCKVTDKTIEAVDRALAGEDYSEGALYFMNRKTSSKKNVRWFDNNLEYLFKHGAHEFFK